MKTAITFRGTGIKDAWKFYLWSIEINGSQFEYHTGMGLATPHRKPNFGTMNKKLINSVSHEKAWVHIPNIDEVLSCLFSDTDAGLESFNEFCDNMGYSNDSLHAFDVYRACAENGQKLRKALGAEYEAQRTRVIALEL